MQTIVVLGSGMAGYTVIRELRKLNPDIPVTLVTRDSADYYSKPTLSNAFAQGKDANALVLTPAQKMVEQQRFELIANTEMQAIEVADKKIRTSNGTIAYDKLVLALGADPIRISLQGDAANEVLSVNDLLDYARFRAALQGVKSVVIMGGGLIGCEFANDLVLAGYRVTVIDPAAYPLASLMPQHAGKQLLAPLQKVGVNWRLGVAVQAVDKQGKGYRLTLNDGGTIAADLVLSAVGLRSRTALAKAAGLQVNRGIVVDRYLRTSHENIFALGDCAEIDGRVLPYVLPIMHAARALAKTINGEQTEMVFPAMPVVVKTPTHPVAVSPVTRDAVGAWQTLADGDGIKLGFFDAQNKLTGFVLTGEFAAERNEMSKLLA